jgi:hypothetical protein
VLPPLLALDAWYGLQARGGRASPLPGGVVWAGGLIAGLAALLVNLPLIAAWLPYPRVNASTLPGMVVLLLLFTPAVAWLGARIGQFVGGFERAPAEPDSARYRRRIPAYAWWSALMFIAALAFTAYFIATATPPL